MWTGLKKVLLSNKRAATNLGVVLGPHSFRKMRFLCRTTHSLTFITFVQIVTLDGGLCCKLKEEDNTGVL